MKGSAGQKRSPIACQRHIEGRRGDQRKTFVGTAFRERIEDMIDEISETPMGNHHALGTPGRSGGVNHVGEIRRRRGILRRVLGIAAQIACT